MNFQKILPCFITAVLLSNCTGPGKDYPATPEVAAEAPPAISGHRLVRIILQVDGGGIMGVTPARLLAELEKRVNARTAPLPLGSRLDMCSGTSTGSIITAMLSNGLSAQQVNDFYDSTEPGHGVWLFRTQKKPFNVQLGSAFLLRNGYKREPFLKALDVALGKVTLGGMKNKPVLMIPAFETRGRKSMFFRSREADGRPSPYYANRTVAEVVSWSALSAANYFGQIDVDDLTWDQYDAAGNRYRQHGAVFQDGGQGTQNNSLYACLQEIIDRHWDVDDVILISLGTGNDSRVRTAEQVKYLGRWGEIMDFSSVGDNQARNEAWQLQVNSLRRIQNYRSFLHFYRFDYEDVQSHDMDDASDSALKYYRDKADEITGANGKPGSKAFNKLVDELSRLHSTRQSAPLVPDGFQPRRSSAALPASH